MTIGNMKTLLKIRKNSLSIGSMNDFTMFIVLKRYHLGVMTIEELRVLRCINNYDMKRTVR